MHLTVQLREEVSINTNSVEGFLRVLVLKKHVVKALKKCMQYFSFLLFWGNSRMLVAEARSDPSTSTIDRMQIGVAQLRTTRARGEGESGRVKCCDAQGKRLVPLGWRPGLEPHFETGLNESLITKILLQAWDSGAIDSRPAA